MRSHRSDSSFALILFWFLLSIIRSFNRERKMHGYVFFIKMNSEGTYGSASHPSFEPSQCFLKCNLTYVTVCVVYITEVLLAESLKLWSPSLHLGELACMCHSEAAAMKQGELLSISWIKDYSGSCFLLSRYYSLFSGRENRLALTMFLPYRTERPQQISYNATSGISRNSRRKTWTEID